MNTTSVASLAKPNSMMPSRDLPTMTAKGRPALLWLDPDFDPLSGDPRFQELCQEKQP